MLFLCPETLCCEFAAYVLCSGSLVSSGWKSDLHQSLFTMLSVLVHLTWMIVIPPGQCSENVSAPLRSLRLSSWRWMSLTLCLCFFFVAKGMARTRKGDAGFMKGRLGNAEGSWKTTQGDMWPIWLRGGPDWSGQGETENCNVSWPAAKDGLTSLIFRTHYCRKHERMRWARPWLQRVKGKWRLRERGRREAEIERSV